MIPSNVLTLVQINLDNGLSTASEIKALDTVNLAVAQSNPPAGVSVEMSGTPAFRQQMQNEMSMNTGMLIGGALILMIIVMGLLFSYVSHRFIPVLFVALGLTTAMGLMGFGRYPADSRGNGSISGHDRSWDRLCDPVPFPARRGGPERFA